VNHADVRYLEAKRTVDDRALDRRVRDRLLAALPDAPRVLEAGAGTGVTVSRLREWGVGGRYRGVDRAEAVVERARERARDEPGVELADGAGGDGGDADATDEDGDAPLTVGFEVGDALSAFAGDAADLLVAQAFLDLVPLGEALSAFEAALSPGGLLYAPITFDGGTIFQPDHPADDAVVAAYHDRIDARSGRDVRAGRHALDRLGRRDGDLLAVGASDWVVRPRDGAYPADERFFLSHILEFVERAVDVPERDGWLAARRDQLSAGELTYVAHGYDLLYRAPGP
jgi:hypothetical protein